MRTDSVRVSEDALREVRELIGQTFGANYLPESAIHYRSKKDAQDAHEAIRPTSAELTPEAVKPYLEDDEFKLYKLIWQRFVASQMVPAVFDQTTIEINAGPYLLRATGSVRKFDGFLAVYEEGKDEKDAEDEEPASNLAGLPELREGEVLTRKELKPEQHFTEPPPRFSEATLVKELEEKGIGRPSTYATILSTIQEREYVRREKGRFYATDLGELVADLLIKSFEDIFEVAYTARMEEELDEIEEGKLNWREALREFYDRFEKDLEKASDLMEDYKGGVATDISCERCGKPMLKRMGRHGLFLGCSGYPECEYTRELASDVAGEEIESETTPEVCENCGREMVPKRGRYGPFLACSGYPECKTTRRLNGRAKLERKPAEPIGEACPSCGGELVLRHGRFGEFIACSNFPTCKFTRQKTLGIPCPKQGCSGEIVQRRWSRGRAHRVFYGCSRYPDCDFRTSHTPVAEPCPQCGSPLLLEKISKKEGTIRYCWNESCSYKTIVDQPLAPPVAGA
jgi:DNA topoisomerase-1